MTDRPSPEPEGTSAASEGPSAASPQGPRVSTGAERAAEGTAIPGYEGPLVEHGTDLRDYARIEDQERAEVRDYNAAKLDAFHMAMRGWPPETIVGVEYEGPGRNAFLVRYDGSVYRITVEPA